MRDYGRISPSFWTGTTGRAIREQGKDAVIVALYLLTAPSSSMIGLYYLPIPTLAHETGIPLQGASKALRSLSTVGFALYDETTETVFVLEMAAYQIDDELKAKDHRIKGIRREIERFRKTPFYSKFFERYGRAFRLGGTSPTEGASESHRSQDQEQEQEQEKEQDTEYPPGEVELDDRQGDLLPLPALPGNPTSAVRRAVDRWRAGAVDVLDALNDGRKRVRPSSRGIAASYDSLGHIADRLAAGKSVDDCLHVIAICEAECRADEKAFKWFDAVSPFRPDNFERKCAADATTLAAPPAPRSAVADPKRGQVPVAKGFDFSKGSAR